jgi:hypothetical protein
MPLMQFFRFSEQLVMGKRFNFSLNLMRIDNFPDVHLAIKGVCFIKFPFFREPTSTTSFKFPRLLIRLVRYFRDNAVLIIADVLEGVIYIGAIVDAVVDIIYYICRV